MKNFKIHPVRILKKKIEWRTCNIWRENDQEFSKTDEIHKLLSKESQYITSKINKKNPQRYIVMKLQITKNKKILKATWKKSSDV